jgi:hypothetical protein
MAPAEQSKMNRFPHSRQSHAHADDGARQVIIVVTVIASVLGLGALATDQYLEIAKRQSAGTFEPANANGKGIYTGSVVYMPETGNVCHQWQFDNLNGQFSDKGAVDCNEEGLEGPKNWSTARIRIISDGFRDH